MTDFSMHKNRIFELLRDALTAMDTGTIQPPVVDWFYYSPLGYKQQLAAPGTPSNPPFKCSPGTLRLDFRVQGIQHGSWLTSKAS